MIPKQKDMKTLTVIDLEVNKEFDLVSIDLKECKVVIYSKEYGYCSQKMSKIKFTNNQCNNFKTN